MDSKLRKVITACVIFMVAVISATALIVVFIQNERRNENKNRIAQTAEEETQKDYRAFLKDETFFDKEVNEFERFMENYGKNLSIAATSVERDLRVQVLNENGELVKGQPLYISVNDEKYKDLDQDGILYVADLKPGTYEVGLEALEGFDTPKGKLTVKVKEKIEYTPIADISLLIRTEDEINPAIEDTEEELPESEDESPFTEKMQAEGSEFGIDVSKWNKNIDWNAVKAAGVDFAIIRCGYRGSSTGVLVEDPYFYTNLKRAREAGVKTGLYFFTQATNAVEAVEEASMAVCLNASTGLEYPIFIDTEGAGGNGRADYLDKNTRTEVVKAFCDTIRNAGYEAGIYASRSWFYDNLNMNELDDNVIWLAEYRQDPQYTGKYQLWQYTSSGAIDGIEGRVDFNVSYLRKNE